MRVVNRILFSAVFVTSCFMAQGQALKFGGFSFFNSNQLNSPTGQLFTLTSISKKSLFETPHRLKGAVVITRKIIPGQGEVYVGASQALKLNGPVDSGKAIVITGKTLIQTSVNIDIVNEKGETISYLETAVKLDEAEGQLTIDLQLPPGFYTLQIPVADGMASKTVIVQ